MSILIYAESSEGKFKKTAFELASYAKKIAEQTNSSVSAVVFNCSDASELGKYGVSKVIKINQPNLQNFVAQAYAETISQVAKNEGITVVVLSTSADSLYLSPLVSVSLQAGYASNVVALPESLEPFKVKRNSFSSKAFGIVVLKSAIKIIGLSKNSFGLVENPTQVSETDYTPTLSDHALALQQVSVEKGSGKVTIADAEVVVSGGRGLKGPENWGILEELAESLGAATACSKPVSDLGWRPHSEHVGQTGKPVASNLYIAVGISGAIQHLAGVNASKVKVVINTDPEAPFFKAADYGIVGDAFEIVPKLTQKIKEFKAQNH